MYFCKGLLVAFLGRILLEKSIYYLGGKLDMVSLTFPSVLCRSDNTNGCINVLVLLKENV